MRFTRPSRAILHGVANIFAVRRLALVALVVTASACASGGTGSGARRGSSTRIVRSELVNLEQYSAYVAVQRLRPRWFQTRTGGLPQVHVDGTPQAGGAESLRNIPVSDIEQMVFLNAADATTRFGTNYVSGVILVTRRTGR